MKLETQLFEECKSNGWNCSITYQKINDFSIEIYTGYKSNYRKIYYSDGDVDKEKAIKTALKAIFKGVGK